MIIRLLVRTVRQNLEDFRFRSRCKRGEIRRCCRRRGRRGDNVVGLLDRDRRRLDMLSAKKKAKLSVREIPGVEEGKGEEE